MDEFRGDTEWPSKDGRFDFSSFSDGTFVLVKGNLLVPGANGSVNARRLQFSPQAQHLPVHSLHCSGKGAGVTARMDPGIL